MSKANPFLPDTALKRGTLDVHSLIPSTNLIYTAFMHTAKEQVHVVWKPEEGELDKRPGINGKFYLREAAAYEMSLFLPVGVPTTFVYSHGMKLGAVQRWLEYAVIGDYINMDYMLFINLDQWRWAAAFDYVIGNNDRHSGNWMIDTTGRLWLIDNGSSFPEVNDCWRGSLSTLRPMINRHVAITDGMKEMIARSADEFYLILDAVGLVDSIEPMRLRIETFTQLGNFADLVIKR